jgi:parallel beta-helix repeat protein
MKTLLSDLLSYALKNGESAMNRTFFRALLTLFLAGVLATALNVPLARTRGNQTTTITINPDGSVTPSTAPISTTDNTTYTFTADIMNYSIIVNRSSIVLNGAGHALHGAGSGIGISLTSVDNVTIGNINIVDFDYGVYLNSSSYDTISGNHASTNSFNGIDLYQSSNNNVSWNNAAADGCGIYLEYSSGNNVSWNNAAADGCGICLGSSSNNTVSQNNAAKNSFFGIELFHSSNNTVCENAVTANNSTGMELVSSSRNTFYHNNFDDNKKQVSSDGSPNTWDNGYPSGGNYWSDYQTRYSNASENDSSGIWNTSYVIDNNNTDYYPLVQPWPVSTPVTPEFSPLVTLPLFVIATLLTALIFKKHTKPSHTPVKHRRR